MTLRQKAGFGLRLFLGLLMLGAVIPEGNGQALRGDVPANRASLMLLSDSLSRLYWDAFWRARERAVQLGLEADFVSSEGVRYSLQRIENGLPYYFRTFNGLGAITSGSDQLHPMGSQRLYLTGRSITAGVWDEDRIYDAHPEFGGRVVLINQIGDFSSHATHVAGSMIATGLTPNARGIAFEGRVRGYDWNNDLAEMATEAGNGLILSNHSYGVPLGWELVDGEWKWMGATSASEDFRFGFYSNTSRRLDQVAFEAPYYTIVWASGNDRSDRGDGTKPADGPFDTIGPEGVAKNVITVGAVRNIPGGYQRPSDLVMTDFSSWGPADDGRIKPDLVTKGVQVYSTGLDDGYQSLSGTSMAAPLASGALMLIQELYYRISSGQYLRAASLKGLAIHTANAANAFSRPDYSYGWGLLDAGKMARFLTHLDTEGLLFVEETLPDSQVFEYDFFTDTQQSLMATLSWTDPPGTPVQQQLNPTDLMLVNDLDMRIIHESGQEYFPWILNPAIPSALAGRGDNFRDNVEKIVVDTLLPGSYKLVISHKGNLRNGEQAFSLFLQTGDLPEKKNLYWIGGDGLWDDGNNWSLVSGGTAAGVVPGNNDHVVLDVNSFSEATQLLSLEEDVYCYSLTLEQGILGRIGMNGHTMYVGTSLFSSQDIIPENTEGELVFSGDASFGTLWMQGQHDGQASGLRIIFDQEDGRWQIPGTLTAAEVVLRKGSLNFSGETARIKKLRVEPAGAVVSLDLGNTAISGLGHVFFPETPGAVKGDQAILEFSSPEEDIGPTGAHLTTGNVRLKKLINQTSLRIEGLLETEAFDNHGLVYINEGLDVNQLGFSSGAGFYLEDHAFLMVGESFNGSGTPGRLVPFAGSGNQTYISGREEKVFCLDYLEVINLPVKGPGVFNAGANSIVTGSEGWLSMECDQVFFADFSYAYPCRDSWTFFNDLSTGNIQSWNWEFDQLGSSTLRHPVFTFRQTGDFPVRLTVGSEAYTHTVTKNVTIIENPLPQANVHVSGTIYFVDVAARNYQWYRNGVAIPGANMQTYSNAAGQEGVYTALISNDEQCNRPARNQIVVGTADMPSAGDGVRIYPNPSDRYMQIVAESEMKQLTLFDTGGRPVFTAAPSGTHFLLNLSAFAEGLYILRVESTDRTVHKKILIDR